MKKTRLQVMIEFTSMLHHLKASKNPVRKIIKANKNRATVLCSLILFTFLFSGTAHATTYYSRTSGGSWSSAATWSTVTYGNAINPGTFPQAGDIANIGNGYTVNINTAVNCATINVGQGVSGIL